MGEEKISFSKGDIVKLKSGSPLMTVYGVKMNTLNQRILCQWFIGSILQADEFHPDMLIKVGEEDNN